MKPVLLAITGASPQVLTETVYALSVQGKTLPEVIHVITTADAKALLVKGLFVDGEWANLVRDYQLPPIEFDESHIHVISDAKGNELVDAKGEDDQSIMADYITRMVATLTSDTEIAIHASIAGGRKTMAFYLGYAMSLFGREQDTLSHVFVNERFEFVPTFFYPTPDDHWIEGRAGQGKINAKEAQVTLAEIPFVRMRNHFDSKLLSHLDDASFSKTVALMNKAQDTLNITINLKERSLAVAGITIKLSPKLLALYLFMLFQPARRVKLSTQFVKETQHTKHYLDYFYQMRGDVRVYTTFGILDEGDFIRREFADLKPLSAKFMQEVRTQLHNKLAEKLPNELVEKIKIHSDGVKGGSTYHIEPDINIHYDYLHTSEFAPAS